MRGAGAWGGAHTPRARLSLPRGSAPGVRASLRHAFPAACNRRPRRAPRALGLGGARRGARGRGARSGLPGSGVRGRQGLVRGARRKPSRGHGRAPEARPLGRGARRAGAPAAERAPGHAFPEPVELARDGRTKRVEPEEMRPRTTPSPPRHVRGHRAPGNPARRAHDGHRPREHRALHPGARLRLARQLPDQHRGPLHEGRRPRDVVAFLGGNRPSGNPVLLDFGKTRASHDNGIGDDGALLDVFPEFQRLVSPTMCAWGGPRGAYTLTVVFPSASATVDPWTPTRGSSRTSSITAKASGSARGHAAEWRHLPRGPRLRRVQRPPRARGLGLAREHRHGPGRGHRDPPRRGAPPPPRSRERRGDARHDSAREARRRAACGLPCAGPARPRAGHRAFAPQRVPGLHRPARPTGMR